MTPRALYKKNEEVISIVTGLTGEVLNLDLDELGMDYEYYVLWKNGTHSWIPSKQLERSKAN